MTLAILCIFDLRMGKRQFHYYEFAMNCQSTYKTLITGTNLRIAMKIPFHSRFFAESKVLNDAVRDTI
jgi:hypothetical protein